MSMKGIIVDRISEFSSRKKGIVILVVLAGLTTYLVCKKSEEKKVEQAHKEGFENGLYEGVRLSSKIVRKLYIDPPFAAISLAKYIANIDGTITSHEKKQIDNLVNQFHKNIPQCPEVFEKELEDILNNNITFSDVAKYLDSIDISDLKMYEEIMLSTVNIDRKVTYQEKVAIEEFKTYCKERYSRKEENSNQENSSNMFEEEHLLLSKEEINDAVKNYSLRYKLLDLKFKKQTKLSKSEVSLVMIATALQIIRIYLLNNITEKEKANIGKKEKALKKSQKKVLSKFESNKKEKIGHYYAPLNMIISTPGVPYDVQKYQEGKNLGLFKGGDNEKGVNHRFATLGHDPLVGLLVGTINIMTNTITSTRKKIPLTYHVVYTKEYKSPFIENRKASFLKALNASYERTKKDPKPFVAAFIKQLIHIATDTYTIAGIQIPGANLILNENQVEKLTGQISFGDLAKFGTSYYLNELINTIIRLLYLIMVQENGGDINDKLTIVKANKIIDYSNILATGSNVIISSITNKFDNLDFAGLSTTLFRCFNDVNFLYEVKYEFINSGLRKMYRENVPQEDII